MKTVQMTLDDSLVKEVDSISKKLHTSRSAFTRKALKSAIKEYRSMHLESKHRKGYEQQPVQENEFSDWENEQEWGDS